MYLEPVTGLKKLKLLSQKQPVLSYTTINIYLIIFINSFNEAASQTLRFYGTDQVNQHP